MNLLLTIGKNASGKPIRKSFYSNKSKKAVKEIAELCGVSLTSAKYRAERMKILYERQNFLTSPLERKIYEQFKDFIETEKSNY